MNADLSHEGEDCGFNTATGWASNANPAFDAIVNRQKMEDMSENMAIVLNRKVCLANTFLYQRYGPVLLTFILFAYSPLLL